MTDTTIEDAVADFIREAVDAAAEGKTLHGAEVHDTVYTQIGDYGYRVGDCTSDVAPVNGDEEGEDDDEQMDEWDARLTLVCFALVGGADQSDRKAARTKARKLMLAVCARFAKDTTAGGRLRDVLVGRCKRGFDLEGDNVYAVANVPLHVNGTGQLLSEREERW